MLPQPPIPHIVTQNYITGSAACLSEVITKVLGSLRLDGLSILSRKNNFSLL